ncbi:helitron_like_N domain-containing protein [Trichonephila clavata]|uniref:Helitron_like_N domain-containing protein n=1 Tax=Trichonephila clavata TaxID=2740835 RepID=A0A8X6M1E6_TRICU|nr:helitron_like_N domain-containing protein [Trichonephila clavata]
MADFKLCTTRKNSQDSDKVPMLSRSNGFVYPPKQDGLPALDPISVRLVSPRLPFMQISRFRYNGRYSIIEQVLNVLVDVDTMVQQLPRQLDDDQVFNVNIKKNMMHKSMYLSGMVKKSELKAWLQFLLVQPLYKHCKIAVHWDSFHTNSIISCVQPTLSVTIQSSIYRKTEVHRSRRFRLQDKIWQSARLGWKITPLALIVGEFSPLV